NCRIHVRGTRACHAEGMVARRPDPRREDAGGQKRAASQGIRGVERLRKGAGRTHLESHGRDSSHLRLPALPRGSVDLSILAALLGWTKLPPWALELIVIGLVAGGIWYWHHATLERGIAQGVAKQVTADDAATAKVKEKAARDTAALRARGEAAEKAYAQAQLDLQAYRSAHPVG